MRVELYTVAVQPGCVSMMAHPRGDDWLEDEMAALQAAGVDVVVSLLTAEEIWELGLLEEGQLCEDIGLRFLSFPIRDGGVPVGADFPNFLQELNDLLHQGKHLAIHCRMGIGRAGLTAASLLVLNGYTPERACEELSRKRNFSVPDTDEQRDWVKALYQHMQEQG